MKDQHIHWLRRLLAMAAFTCLFGLMTMAATNKPAATKITSAKVDTGKVVLEWEKVSDASGYYVLWHKTDGTTEELVKISNPNTVRCTIKKLTNGTAYRFSVMTYKKDKSQIVKGKDSKVVKVVPKAQKPGKVGGIYVTCGDSYIKLKWGSVQHANKYEVYSKGEDGKFELIRTTGRLAVTISGLENGTKYVFKVRAIAKSGNEIIAGAFSNTVTGKPTSGKETVTDPFADIHPYYWSARMKETVRIKSTDGTKTVTFNSGQKVTVEKTTTNLPGTVYIIANDKKYKTAASNISIDGFITDKSKYISKAHAEDWVNTRGFSSKTEYLLWCNTYTQRLYVFKGYRFNWSCINVYVVSTGVYGYETPLTKYGEVGGKVYEIQNGPYQSLYYCVACPGGYMHYWPVAPGFGGRAPGVPGTPASRGCTRVTDRNAAKWIYDNIPRETHYMNW